MRRRFRHALLWFLLITTTVMAGNHLLQEFRETQQVLRQDLPTSARARPVYLLDEAKWTTFRLPSTAKRLKVLSRANLSGGTEALLDLEFPYHVDYQLESLNGDLLARGSFAILTKISPTVNLEGRPTSAVFYVDTDLIPSIAKVATLELPADQLTLLKLRSSTFESPIKDISARLFIREELPERKLSYRWERLRDTSRRNLASARIHDLVDLTFAEQRGILINRWKPIGAQGVSGRDYRERTVYLRNDLLPAKQVLIEPLGLGELRVGPARRSILGIPASGGRLRLEVRRVSESSTNDAALMIRHFGETIQERSTQEVLLKGEITSVATGLTSGMIEIESPVDIAITPYLTAVGGVEQMLERDPAITRAWQTGPDQTIDFALGGDRSNGGVFRVSVRPLQAETTTLETVYLDEGNHVMGRFERVLTEIIPSLYDVLITPEGEIPVHDPIEVISELPAGVQTVRFLADKPILINAHTRPDNLLHRTRVPADYVRALPDPQRQPIWFGLRPIDADALIRAHRSALIHVQTRPPEDDADILAGQYQWEDYQPEKGAFGQYLLNNRDPASRSRLEALPSLYLPLVVGQSQILPLAQVPGLDLPARRLAYFRNSPDRARLKVLIDGKVLLDRELVTKRGELLLPPIPPHSRRILVDCAAAGFQCFLNYVDPSQATKIKRLAQRVSAGDSLTFTVEKSGAEDELLTGMLFAAPGATEAMEVEVSIEAISESHFLTQSEGFTTRRRLYIITPDEQGVTPVLGGKMPYVDGGQRFFIPLGSDLTPGNYTVTMSLHKGSDGYLTLSKVTGGDYADARFFREASR